MRNAVLVFITIWPLFANSTTINTYTMRDVIASAERGNTHSQFIVGKSLYNNESVEPDIAFKYLLAAANKGHGGAQYIMFELYRDGLTDLGVGTEGNVIVARDKVNKLLWLLKSANGGNKDALYELGLFYIFADQITEDEREAIKYFRRAAEHGHGRAAMDLGFYYLKGIYIKKDIGEGIRWLVRSTELGYVESNKFLSRIYKNGEYGVKKDKKLSEYWKEKINDLSKTN